MSSALGSRNWALLGAAASVALVAAVAVWWLSSKKTVGAGEGAAKAREPVAATAAAATATAATTATKGALARTDSPSGSAREVAEDLLRRADEAQQDMMQEPCIVVDSNDKVLGPGSKKDCHIMENIRGGLLHRAFSVFLFNRKGQLLLQRRSPVKITFPDFWANTCCSHPLFTASEMVEADHAGVKAAAQRKLHQELGIPIEDLPLASFTFITRVHYRASSPPEHVWGEHEIDHILLVAPARDVRLNLNPNEVAETRYFSEDELRAWVARSEAPDSGTRVSPWFRILERDFLPRWWDAVRTLRERQRSTGVARDDDGQTAFRGLVDEAAIYRAGDFDTPGEPLPVLRRPWTVGLVDVTGDHTPRPLHVAPPDVDLVPSTAGAASAPAMRPE